MKKHLLSLALIIIGFKANSQNFNFVKTFGLYNYLDFYGMCVDASGNVYATGVFWSKTDFDPGDGTYNLTPTSGSYNDVFIAKYDSYGNLIWVKSFGGNKDDNGSSIKMDKSGNIYLTGTFSGPVDFDPGSGTFFLTSKAQQNSFISKFDAAGNFIWAKMLESSTYFNISSLSFDISNNIYLTGAFTGTADFDPNAGTVNLTSAGSIDIFILKLSPSGNYIQAFRLGGKSNDYGGSIATDSLGNIYSTGSFSGIVDFDPGTSTNNLTSTSKDGDIFVLRLDTSGKFGWAKSMGGEYIGTSSISLDKSGNIYTTGWFTGKADFDPGTGTYYLTENGTLQNGDIYVSKLNNSGDFVWAKGFGGKLDEQVRSVNMDDSGNIYISGTFQDTVDFDPGTGSNVLIAPTDYTGNYTNSFISKVNSSGNFTWTRQLGDKNYVSIYTMTLNKSGSIYLAGNFGDAGDSVDFDPGKEVYDLDSRITGSQFFLKLSNCLIPNKPTAIYGLSALCAGSTTKYYTDSVKGAEGYLWKVPTDAVIKKGQNTNSIEVIFGNASGDIVVAAKDACGYSKPKSFSVRVNPLPYLSITVNPASTICSGTSIRLNGNGASSYNWSGGLSNGVPFTPALSNTYIVTGTDANGCVITNSITINVNPTPNFTSTLTDQIVSSGSDARFIAESSSTTASYQWQQNSGTGFINIENFGPFSGVTTKSLTIKNVNSAQDNYGFKCIAKAGTCSDTTNIAKLLISCFITITAQPKDQIANAGNNVSFSVSSINQSDKYQWQKKSGNSFINLNNSGIFSGVTTKNLTLTKVTPFENNTEYRCIISNASCNDTTQTVNLKIDCFLTFTDQPNGQTVISGSDVQFTAVSSIPNSTYQWQQNSGTGFINLSNFGQYSGVVTQTLYISDVSPTQNKFGYRCIVSDGGCSDTSNVALLSIKTTNINVPKTQKSFSIFPNPANNFFIIESFQTPTNLPYILTDQTGRQILKGKLNSKTSTVDISALAHGFYFLQIGEVNREVFKIMKQ